MDQNWTKAITWVLDEPGGSPLSIAEHNAFRAHHGDPPLQDVKQAARYEVETIYRIAYWQPFAVTLPSGLDYFFFETAACTTLLLAIEEMQRALGVDPDGHVGVVTTQEITRVVKGRALTGLLDAYAGQRRDTYNKDRIVRALERAKTMVGH